MRVDVLVAPTTTPITIDDCQLHLRLDDDADETSWFNLAIAAAVEYAEAFCSRSFMSRQLQVTYFQEDRIPRNQLYRLPSGPAVSIDQVQDQSGNVLSSSLYQLQRIGTTDYAKINSGIWPPVIRYTAGYASAAAVPARIRQAMLMHVAHLWDNRSATTTRPMTHVYHGLEAMYGQLTSEMTL